ncbi:MAG: enoyl-CoA hydratase [Solirubrobacterales bacterium]|jgi:2-(1,2-epoxy-1,2-dihydrophenyl)acetyl-CoA isomerase|nr:enoyl-CoA hydratase [Solirubrobacterales bacterium]
MSEYELVHAYETVNLHRAGGVAKIELNRPETRNAWNQQFGSDLLAAVEATATDPEVRCVLLTGAGPGFSSGADLKDRNQPVTPEGRPDVLRVLTERYHPIIRGLRTMEKPVVSAVHGGAVGIGLSLALSADLVLAAESSYFLLAFVNIGLVPDGGSSVFVPNRIGFTRAAELAMLGEKLPAPKALEWGLVNRVYPDDALGPESEALAGRLAAGPTRSYAGTKRQLNAWMQGRMEAQLELEATLQAEMAGSSDFVEGAMAFVQKRQPSFQGS